MISLLVSVFPAPDSPLICTARMMLSHRRGHTRRQASEVPEQEGLSQGETASRTVEAADLAPDSVQSNASLPHVAAA